MTRIILKSITVNGQTVYVPLDKEDSKAIGDRPLIVADMKGQKATRTALQNSAIHLYYTTLADALNDAGWDMITTLDKISKNVDIPWTPSAIKERLWRAVQLAMTEKESTTKLDRDEVSKIYEALNRVTASKLGISVGFPDKHLRDYERLYGDVK